MIRELIGAGGTGVLVPVALATGAMYAVNWLLGFEHRRSERRRQFLELWPKRVADDDLWSQVAIRHLTGEYLPQAIVNVAMAQPDKAVTLIELAQAWDYLELTNTSPPLVRWKRSWYQHGGRRRLVRWALNLGYFPLAWLAAWLLMAVVRSPVTPLTWLWGFIGLIAGLMAIGLLAQDHRLKNASELAPRWIARMNELLDDRQTQEPSGLRQ